jgi:hypothetical protein
MGLFSWWAANYNPPVAVSRHYADKAVAAIEIHAKARRMVEACRVLNRPMPDGRVLGSIDRLLADYDAWLIEHPPVPEPETPACDWPEDERDRSSHYRNHPDCPG